MNTAVGSASSTAVSSGPAPSSDRYASTPTYWWSAKGSHTWSHPSAAIAARSSSRRPATTSSPSAKPPNASHSVTRSGYAGGKPPRTVITVAPGRTASTSPQPSTASSKCGDITTSRSSSASSGLDQASIGGSSELRSVTGSREHHEVVAVDH